MPSAKKFICILASLVLSATVFAGWSLDEPEENVSGADAAGSDLSFSKFSFGALTDALIAAESEEVPELRLKGMQDYRGMYVTAFHISGRRSQIGGSVGHVLTVSEIKSRPATALIDPTGSAVIPRTTVERNGFRVFNFIVIVIHRQETHYLRSSDDSIVKDPRVPHGDMREIHPSSLSYVRNGYVSVLDRLSSFSGSAASESVELRLGTDF